MTTEDTWGVNYRALQDLFELTEARMDVIKYEVGVQMLEIYNEQVKDLLVIDGSNRRYPFNSLPFLLMFIIFFNFFKSWQPTHWIYETSPNLMILMFRMCLWFLLNVHKMFFISWELVLMFRMRLWFLFIDSNLNNFVLQFCSNNISHFVSLFSHSHTTSKKIMCFIFLVIRWSRTWDC